MLPFSRMTHYPGNAVAAEPSLSLRIDKRDFDDMLRVSHEFGQRLVGEMSNRVRGDVRLEQQREKMVSLGRLSAGLAHELNNPAAAIQSTATNLKDRLSIHTNSIITIFQHNLKETSIEAITQLLSRMGERDFPNISPLQRGEREEEFTDWMEDQGINDSWELASVFTAAGLQVSDLVRFAEAIPQSFLGDALTWLAGNSEVDRMVSEIKFSAGRISELVSSVKTYSHMDQSAEHKSTNVQEGLENTLKMFGHKLKQKKIVIKREFSEDIPVIHGNAGELNQVWTHLIDNAVDAMTEGGNLCIEIRKSDWGIDVKIIDDGAGIPEDIRHRIFDPCRRSRFTGWVAHIFGIWCA